MMKAIFPISGDPIHLGHLWVAERVSTFMELAVVLADNNDKKYMFSLEERMAMAKECLPASVKVDSCPKMFIADYAKSKGVNVLVRGIRTAEDFSYERTMQEANEQIWKTLTTIYLSPPFHLSCVKSSAIRGLMGYDQWEKHLAMWVPPNVMRRLTCIKTPRSMA